MTFIDFYFNKHFDHILCFFFYMSLPSRTSGANYMTNKVLYSTYNIKYNYVLSVIYFKKWENTRRKQFCCAIITTNIQVK